MKQAIIRLDNTKEDVDVLISSSNEQLFKTMDRNAFLKFINKNFKIDVNSNIKPKIIHPNIYASSDTCKVIVQEEQMKIISYNGAAYKIRFPNSIYVISHDISQVNSVSAYCYKKFNGLKTVLYKYPMPNMLGGNKICLGTANKSMKNGIEKALETIISTEFTHRTVNNINKFKNTGDYFTYLAKEKFPYDLLIKANLKVGDLVDE